MRKSIWLVSVICLAAFLLTAVLRTFPFYGQFPYTMCTDIAAAVLIILAVIFRKTLLITIGCIGPMAALIVTQMKMIPIYEYKGSSVVVILDIICAVFALLLWVMLFIAGISKKNKKTWFLLAGMAGLVPMSINGYRFFIHFKVMIQNWSMHFELLRNVKTPGLLLLYFGFLTAAVFFIALSVTPSPEEKNGASLYNGNDYPGQYRL